MACETVVYMSDCVGVYSGAHVRWLCRWCSLHISGPPLLNGSCIFRIFGWAIALLIHCYAHLLFRFCLHCYWYAFMWLVTCLTDVHFRQCCCSSWFQCIACIWVC